MTTTCDRCSYRIVPSVGGIYHGPELLCMGCYRHAHGAVGHGPVISVTNTKKEGHAVRRATPAKKTWGSVFDRAHG
jgi:hypothetical protein